MIDWQAPRIPVRSVREIFNNCPYLCAQQKACENVKELNFPRQKRFVFIEENLSEYSTIISENIKKINIIKYYKILWLNYSITNKN